MICLQNLYEFVETATHQKGLALFIYSNQNQDATYNKEQKMTILTQKIYIKKNTEKPISVVTIDK